MVREALTGAWSLVSGTVGGVRSAVSGRPGEIVRLQERVRELERQVAELRAATDPHPHLTGTTS